MAVSIRRLLAWVALCAATVAHATEYAAHTLARPDGERRYLVLDPGAPDVSGKRPMVILLHGHGEEAASSCTALPIRSHRTPAAM